MYKKMISLAMALVMCLSLSVSAFAAESGADGNCDTYYMSDGTIITVTIVPATKPLTRTGLYFSDTATASTLPFNYNLLPAQGNNCDVRVWNDASASSGKTLAVTVVISGNSQPSPITINRTVTGDNICYVGITGKDGAGINGSVKTTIKPSGGATSVPFTYQIDQNWA